MRPLCLLPPTLACVFGVVLAGAAEAGPFRFAHHFIDADAPRSEDIVGFAETALADLDRDGDLDFVVGYRSRGEGALFWYEYRAPDRWVRHVVGKGHQSDVAATVFDVDADGWPDVVCSGVWFQNPKNPREAEFVRHVFDGKARGGHDALMADLNGDGRKDLVLMGDLKTELKELCWYLVPKNPANPWQRISIGPPVHGAITPGGFFDIDGDGDIDIVRADTWYKNADGRGHAWIAHANLPVGRVGPYGMCVRSAAADLDGDGRAELVVADADIVPCGVYILRNADGRGGRWEKQALPQSFTYGSLHSLAVADFDGDGDPDILVNEQEDMLPAGRTNPRWVIWENAGAGAFVERIILDRQLGGHELVVGDVDGDGDIDICSKPWRTTPWNGVGGRLHIDFLENKSARRR